MTALVVYLQNTIADSASARTARRWPSTRSSSAASPSS